MIIITIIIIILDRVNQQRTHYLLKQVINHILNLILIEESVLTTISSIHLRNIKVKVMFMELSLRDRIKIAEVFSKILRISKIFILS